MIPTTNSVKNLSQQFEKKPSNETDQKYLRTPVKPSLLQVPLIASTSSSTITKEREEVTELSKRRAVKNNVEDIDKKNKDAENCKPRIEMGEAKLSIPLTEFKFKVERNGSVAPDFYDLKVVDISFEFKNHDEAVSNEQAICKLRKNERDTHFTHFECKTDMNGRFKQVLPPGFVDINIPSFGIEVNSKIIEPAQVTTRADALKINTSLKTTSKNSKLAGSSIIEEGQIVILGDASGSMKGSPFKTLIDCFNNFVQSKAFITGDLKISIALWGSTTEWFKHRDTIEPTDLDALNQFLNVWSVPLLGNTLL
ncbi:predicted protein [Naegleria gruberi]|uniref:Predicted protein n=1 Tax=Naegleria gruberi TaxID=5762 RepID=D2W650_NAEGR|nr:uncharacterized protein NAEGRDRAFT_54905 [Naegleria gruberi]EFC35453.1 predicted protein [Naegleria gruberi]|eukprot:XP_002668197.1 predicted protein [Naegleria gruberi strain NEG-M]